MIRQTASHAFGIPRQTEDERLFAALAAEWRVWGLRLALKITGDPECAEDALQDALLRALRHASKLKEPAAAQAWFRRIVVRCALDHLPTRAGEESRLDGICAPNADLSTNLAVRKTLSMLKSEQRGLLALAIGEGLSYEEIAQALDIPVGTVGSRLHAAKQAFRDLWEDKA